MTKEPFVKNNTNYFKITMKSGDIVCETCKPKTFYRNLFHFPIRSNCIRTSSFRKASLWETATNSYSIWITVFNNENKYNDYSVWLEEIDKKGTIITRRFLRDENKYDEEDDSIHIIYNTSAPDNDSDRRLFVVFGRDKLNIKFYGVFKQRERKMIDNNYTIIYERVNKEFSYNIKDIPNFK